MKIKAITLCAFSISLSITAHAEQAFSFLGKLSTLGITAEMAYAKSSHTELFGNISAFNYDKDINVSNSEFTADTRLMSLIAGLRYYPSASRFYVGGGLGINNNEAILLPKNIGGKYVLNGNQYDTSEVSLEKKPRASYNLLAPVFIAGWQSKKINETGLSFFGEAGVYFNGNADIESESPCSSASSRCTQLKEDFDRSIAAMKEELDDSSVYPVASLGVRYAF